MGIRDSCWTALSSIIKNATTDDLPHIIAVATEITKLLDASLCHPVRALRSALCAAGTCDVTVATAVHRCLRGAGSDCRRSGGAVQPAGEPVCRLPLRRADAAAGGQRASLRLHRQAAAAGAPLPAPVAPVAPVTPVAPVVLGRRCHRCRRHKCRRLQTLDSRSSLAHEEAIHALAGIANAVGGGFSVYLDALHPHLLHCIQNYEDYNVGAALGCRAAWPSPHSGLFLSSRRARRHRTPWAMCAGPSARTCCASQTPTSRLCCRTSRYVLAAAAAAATVAVGQPVDACCHACCFSQIPELTKSCKPPLIAVFGDIALALAEHFQRYLGHVMTVVLQAAAVTVPVCWPCVGRRRACRCVRGTGSRYRAREESVVQLVAVSVCRCVRRLTTKTQWSSLASCGTASWRLSLALCRATRVQRAVVRSAACCGAVGTWQRRSPVCFARSGHLCALRRQDRGVHDACRQ
jgi:hypothetical protein